MKHIKKLVKGIAFCLVIVGTLLFVSRVSSSYADEGSPPKGVDHLRGRWDGVIENLDDTDQPLILLLNDFAPDPNNSQVTLAAGCLAVGEDGERTPVSARAEDLGDGNFNLTVLGTVASGDDEAFIIRLAGLARTFDPGVADDDVVNGSWTTAEAEGNWSATHHDRRRSQCPPANNIPGLSFDSDVYVAHNYFGDDLVDQITILEGITNIVSSGMQVRRPDGTSIVVPFYTDVFSPDVDFISEFRYLTNEPGNAISGQAYTFTLLNALGDPIPGTTQTDVWTACLQEPPRNVNAVVTEDLDIDLSWNPVPVVPGFDPGNQIGFYQIGIDPWPEGGLSVYGANGIESSSHLIPWDDFGISAPGSPDGFDRGDALSEFDNGNYQIIVDSFSVPAPGNPGHRLECFTADLAENLYFAKSDNAVSFFIP